MKIRLSKKFIFLLSGALVLCGASGSAAVLIGTDKILGPSYKDINGLTCTTLQTQKMRRDGSIWVRKYVTSDQAGDGISRLKTALRVARAVQEKEKAGLVQVAMIDSAGPKDTADMRGRAIAAQVVYIPNPTKIPAGGQTENYSAYYLDGAPSASGHFYGMRVDLPLEDIEHLEAHLTDKADCVDLSLPEGNEAAKAESEASEHGAPAAGGEKASGHGAAAATEGAAGEQAEGKKEEGEAEEVAATESGGFLRSITGMVFGAKEEAPANGHDAASQGEEKVSPAQTEAKADVGHVSAPSEPAREPRTTAEGGKGWSKSDAADEIHSGTAAESQGKPEPKAEAAQAGAHSAASTPAATAENAADAAGAAWLEKFRAQQAPPAAGAAPPAD